jgi:hypothetical protein
MTEKPPIVRPVALVGGLLGVLLLIRCSESDPIVRLDFEQAADAQGVPFRSMNQGSRSGSRAKFAAMRRASSMVRA